MDLILQFCLNFTGKTILKHTFEHKLIKMVHIFMRIIKKTTVHFIYSCQVGRAGMEVRCFGDRSAGSGDFHSGIRRSGLQSSHQRSVTPLTYRSGRRHQQVLRLQENLA